MYIIALLLGLALIGGGFVYLVVVSETMAPAAHEARVDVDVDLPR